MECLVWLIFAFFALVVVKFCFFEIANPYLLKWFFIVKRMFACNDKLPEILHRSLKVGASPEYWFIIPLLAAWGTGIVRVIGLWNFLRLGSTVTIGETATRLPKSLATSSAGIGCAWIKINLLEFRPLVFNRSSAKDYIWWRRWRIF